MKDITAPFPKCVLENSLNPDFPSLEATYFACTIFKIQNYGGENHLVQPFQEEFFFFFGRTELHVWDICHKTQCLEHSACSSWQLWETQGAAQNKIFPFLSSVKMSNTMSPFCYFAPASGEGEKEKPGFV